MMNLPKSLASRIAASGGFSPKGTGGQSVSNVFKSFSRGLQGMQNRPPVIANKARGTMSSANRATMGGMY
jgi:hypothetical protein